MDIFRIDESVADLDHKVDQKKQQITTQATELEALETRIREMDERLRRRRGDTHAPLPDTMSRSAAADVHASIAALEAQRKALVEQKHQVAAAAAASSAAAASQDDDGSAAQTSAAQMPPTPSASEGQSNATADA
jgi:chromosome segregation ATPase